MASLDDLLKTNKNNLIRDFNKQKAGVNYQFSDLRRALQNNARAQQSAFEEDRNRLGLLRSGNTGLGIGEIRRDLASKLSQAEGQKAEQMFNLRQQLKQDTLAERGQTLNERQLGLTENDMANQILSSPNLELFLENDSLFGFLKQILGRLGVEVVD